MWRHPGEFDPVRREAGRWLRKIAERDKPDRPRPAAAERMPDELGAAAVAELQRLRFGHRATWPEPKEVFRRARLAWRAARG